jgi:hypothetical protein
MRGKRRCRLHGGLSTGPRTLEGKKRVRAAVLKHGRYSVIERQVQAIAREIVAMVQQGLLGTRDRFMRQVYLQAARPLTPAELERIRDSVLARGLDG